MLTIDNRPPLSRTKLPGLGKGVPATRPAGWDSARGIEPPVCQGPICPVHPTIATTPRVCDPWRILPIALVWAWTWVWNP